MKIISFFVVALFLFGCGVSQNREEEQIIEKAVSIVNQMLEENLGNDAPVCLRIRIEDKVTPTFYKAVGTLNNGKDFPLTITISDDGIVVEIMDNSLKMSETRRLITNEMKYARSAAVVLGRHIASTHPGQQVVVIAAQNYESNTRQKELIDAMQTSRGGGLSVKAVVSPKIETPEGTSEEEVQYMMMEEMIGSEQFNQIFKQHSDVEVFVSMIGLPRDPAQLAAMSIWQSDAQKLAMLFGEVSMMRRTIKAGKIAAAVSYKPGARFSEDPAPSDPQKAFDERYMLITPENVEKIANEHPGIFMEEK